MQLTLLMLFSLPPVNLGILLVIFELMSSCRALSSSSRSSNFSEDISVAKGAENKSILLGVYRFETARNEK